MNNELTIIINTLELLIKTYPNDADLGEAIRKLFKQHK